ncbi:carbon-nitrogen hydrolase family protein [Sphingomonas sp. A2-49]|uniref:carbon-nitrogen hydrolase family protein n=1 Tax=Sphingomonas sp. A2-49 TaxID=1391375 RepID=UPI0021CFE43A|nr:carbon-nitrogen hydrolase family protein [Sphingomonas sp. A2-49]MCU6454419.1 carbon-nitrogen hydrolase family protein [Sphingomonas sp. A2-49]
MRIAAMQCPDLSDDAAGITDRIAGQLDWADARSIDLVLFPEAVLLGHSYDAATIASRARRSAAMLDRLCLRIARYRATAIVGAFEQIGDRIVNSAIVVEAGQVVGRYAKAHPNEPGVSAGHACPTFVRSGVRYGLNICNDANYPEAAGRIADQGARLILYPLNNMLPPATAERWRDRSIANLIARARQTRCWVAASDVTGAVGDRISYGCTAIISPQGEVVARVPELEAGAVVHDV